MRIGEIKKLAIRTLAFGLLVVAASVAMPAFAQAPPAATPSEEAAPAPVSPDDGSAAPGSSIPEADQPKAAPGVPSDATVETVDVPGRSVALFTGDAEWADGFKSILAAVEKVKAAMDAAGLKQAGHPFAVFLSTDETSFHFEAMVPIADKPDGKSELSDGVKLGESPSGKAIKFLHRGAYDDIDSTYDLITAYLDEKGLEAQNLFIEEYLTNTKESDDASLEADIYVFLK